MSQQLYLVRGNLDDIKAACVQLEDGSRAWHETGMPGLIVCSFPNGQATVAGPIQVGSSPVFNWFEVVCSPSVIGDVPSAEQGQSIDKIRDTPAIQAAYQGLIQAGSRRPIKNSSNQTVGVMPVNVPCGRSPVALALGGQDPDEAQTIPGLDP